MEILEKVTLYDILGYTIPGGVLLFVICSFDFETKLKTFPIIIFVAISYLIGNVLAVVSSKITGFFWKHIATRNKIYLEKEIIELEAAEHVVEKALKKAKILGERGSISNIKEDIWKYYMLMYSDIQSDKNFSRIHNYASAALLYQNMALGTVISIGVLAFQNRLTLPVFFGCIISLLFLVLGWISFDKRVVRYTIHWYVLKYIK